MKRSYSKCLFGTLFIFTLFIFTNTIFCATSTVNDIYCFERPDSWNGNKIYVNLINSTDNSKAFPEPGKEISKVLDKFKFYNIFELNAELYALSITNDIASKGNYDKIVFSNGNDENNITNQTLPIDIKNNVIYTVTDGSGTSQVCKATFPFNIDTVTHITLFLQKLQKINTNIDNEIIQSINNISNNIQNLSADLEACNLLNDILNPLDNINKKFSKDNSLIDDLNKKIDEAKDAIRDEGYTQESVKKLENTITEAENIKNNIDYFTNDQINDIINALDEDIKNLVPDTSKLEEALENAKKVETGKYTDETVKVLKDAIANAEEALKNKSNLTIDKVNELTKALNDAINALKEKNIVNENTNPTTGDILYIVIPLLVLAVLVIAFTVVYSKKKNSLKNK